MGGGKGSKNNTTKSTFTLPKEFIQAYNESLGLAREAIQKPYTPYTGQLVAGLTPGQQQGIADIRASQGMALPFIQEGAGYTREAARGITPELYERFYSPYVRDVADTTFANLMESGAQQRSGLKGGAIQAGAFGGDRAGIAQSEMARQQQLANAQAMSNIYNQGYGQAMGLAGNQVQNLGAMGQQMAGLGLGAQGSVLQGAQAQMAAGAQEQATAQAQLQAAYDQFLQQQSYPFQIAQYFANIAQGLGSTAGGTSTTTAPPPNLASQLIGGATAAGNLMAGAGALSDKRVKENIEAVGQLNDGQTVYRYNFKGDPKTQIGLLAQEVEQINPDAVMEAGGLKMVDYKGATDEAASSMGGVVSPNMDRQGFMNGGTPYGGVSGFIPQSQMMTAGTSKIPQAATPSDGSEFDTPTNAFGASKNSSGSGLSAIAGLFSKPSLYNSGGVVGRHGYATDGGVPFMPYSGARGYVPEGKMGGGGDRIAERAPKPYDDTGLSEEWKDIKPLTKEQVENIKGLVGKVRGFFADPDMAAAGYMTPPSAYETYDPVAVLNDKYGPLKERFASGGVAGRNGYQFGGEPTMEDAMVEAEGMGLVPPVKREPRYDRLIQSESGGDFGARNKQGYVGRAQFGEDRLTDAKRAGVIPAEATAEDFRNNPDMQKAAESWHFNDINNFIDRTGLASMEGKVINGIPVTREGMVNVAHLGGKGGLQKFITSGGVDDRADANGTRLSDYLAMGAANGQNVQPMSADASGLGGAPKPLNGEVMPSSEEPKSRFNMSKLFASEKNPSIVEQIIGRRLSPEARSAMLNASFALMAGKSPFFFTNLGEAGRVGTQTYYNALAQKRELEKQGADIARQSFEAETGRMTAETAQLNAARQLYSQMLPQIRFWQMRNPGKPLPAEFQRVIDAAYPPQGPAGLVQAPGQAPSLSGAAPALPAPEAGVTAPQAPEAPTVGVEAAPIPPSAGETATSGSTELDALYEQLPNELNPNYWTSMAENAMTVEDYNRASERAAELTKQYQESGIPLPSGIISFPGTIERQQQEKLAGLQTEGAYKATSEQTERAQTTVGAYQQSKNTLDQAAEKLAKTKTGQLEETKTYLVTALNSLGLVQDAELLKQATGVQELRKVFSQILFAGGIKDKIGSQIAAKELEMFAAGFGDVNLEPAVNRFIVGTMRGILDMDAQRARDWIEFARKPENRGKTFSRSEIVDWEIKWNNENPISQFVEQSVANTPVAGEIDFGSAASRKQAKPGYKYVLPDGSIGVYNGTDFEVEE